MNKFFTNSLFAAVLAATAVSLGACGSKPATSTTDYIGIDAAKEAALKAAEIPSDDVPYLSAGLDCRNDIYFYQISFTENGVEHSYEIDALTGLVIGESHSPQTQTQAFAENLVNDETTIPAMETNPAPADISAQEGATTTQEVAGHSTGQTSGTQSSITPPPDTQPAVQTQSPPQPPATTQPASGEIDSTAALAAALSHAGVNETDVASNKVKTDIDDGRKIFEVEFITKDGVEYDYDISALDGSVISFDYDAEALFPRNPSPESTTVTAEQAKQSVLALVPEATAKDIRIHLDEDDGRLVYEGSLIYDSTEYDFKIDAYSGSIIEWEAEPYNQHH